MVPHSCLIGFVAILLFASGCNEGRSGIKETQEPQDGVFYLYPEFAYVAVVDKRGNELRLTDGMQLVMDNSTFENVVLPVTTGNRAAEKFAKNYNQTVTAV